jgi:hypothetical protein
VPAGGLDAGVGRRRRGGHHGGASVGHRQPAGHGGVGVQRSTPSRSRLSGPGTIGAGTPGSGPFGRRGPDGAAGYRRILRRPPTPGDDRVGGAACPGRRLHPVPVPGGWPDRRRGPSRVDPGIGARAHPIGCGTLRSPRRWGRRPVGRCGPMTGCGPLTSRGQPVDSPRRHRGARRNRLVSAGVSTRGGPPVVGELGKGHAHEATATRSEGQDAEGVSRFSLILAALPRSSRR